MDALETPVNHARLSQLVAEFVPLNRRRLAGNPPLTVIDLQRWSELRELLAYEFGNTTPIGASVERALRVPSHLKVSYGEEGAESVLSNLSEGGVFVCCEKPLPAGTPLRLEIDPGHGESPIQVDAVVAWNRELANRDGQAGIGVAFQELGAAEASAIGQLVERALHELAGS